jgi:hypothetical protein
VDKNKGAGHLDIKILDKKKKKKKCVWPKVWFLDRIAKMEDTNKGKWM